MGRRFLRRLLIVAAVLAVLLAVAVLLVPRLVPSDLVTEQVIRQAERATGGTVTLDKASVAWRGGWSVVLHEGTMTGSGRDLAAATGTANDLESYAIVFDELSIRPSLLPLLKKRVEVGSFSLAGPQMTFTGTKGTGRIVGYQLQVTDLKLDLEGEAWPPAGAGSGPGRPTAEMIPPGLAFSFTGAVDTLEWQNVPYDQVDLEGGFAEKILTVASLEGRRAGGGVRGRLDVDFEVDPWGRLTFEAEAENVPAVALLEPWVPDLGNRLDCDLSADMVGRCDLKDEATRSRTLDIAGTVTGEQGVLRAGVWLAQVAHYLGDRQDLQDIRFRGLDHDFRLVEGRYLLEKLELGGGEVECRGKGWVDLSGNLELGLDIRLPVGYTPDLGNFSFLAGNLRDSEGRINLPLTLSGPSSNPDVGVALGRLGGR